MRIQYRVGWAGSAMDKYTSRQGFHFNTPDCDPAPAAVGYVESFFMGQFIVGIILKMIDRQCLLFNIKLKYKFTILMYVLIFHVELRGTVR